MEIRLTRIYLTEESAFYQKGLDKILLKVKTLPCTDKELSRCYSRRFATTILSATQRSNVVTALEPFETMSQQCCDAVLR